MTKHVGHSPNSTVPFKSGCPACDELERDRLHAAHVNQLRAGDPDAIKHEKQRKLEREVNGG